MPRSKIHPAFRTQCRIMAEFRSRRRSQRPPIFELGRREYWAMGRRPLEIVLTETSTAEPNAETPNQVVRRRYLAGQSHGQLPRQDQCCPPCPENRRRQSVKAIAARSRRDREREAGSWKFFADDVKCARGATVGRASTSRLWFYMPSRGIDPANGAEKLMLQGVFIADAFVSNG